MVEYLEGGAWRIDLIQEEERSRCNMWSDKGGGKWKVGENWRRKRLCFQKEILAQKGPWLKHPYTHGKSGV